MAQHIVQVQGFTQRPRKGRINYVTLQIEKSSKTCYAEINKQEEQASMYVTLLCKESSKSTQYTCMTHAYGIQAYNACIIRAQSNMYTYAAPTD